MLSYQEVLKVVCSVLRSSSPFQASSVLHCAINIVVCLAIVLPSSGWSSVLSTHSSSSCQAPSHSWVLLSNAHHHHRCNLPDTLRKPSLRRILLRNYRRHNKASTSNVHTPTQSFGWLVDLATEKEPNIHSVCLRMILSNTPTLQSLSSYDSVDWGWLEKEHTYIHTVHGVSSMRPPHIWFCGTLVQYDAWEECGWLDDWTRGREQ